MPTIAEWITLVGLVVASPWLLFRMATRDRYRRGLSERLALRLPPPAVPGRRRVWLHGASAGEMVAVAALARSLQRRHPELDVIVSSTTTSGVDLARRLLADCPSFVQPLDLRWCVGRVLRRVDSRD